MALTYFATRREGHAYDFQKEFEIDRYCSAQVAVKFLERNGWIYPTRVEVGGRGYVRRKIYRLSAIGFLEFLRENMFLELVKKAFEVHQELCPAFFGRLSKLKDDDLKKVVSWMASKGLTYFWDADLDNFGLTEVDMAAPFVFASMLFDYKVAKPFLTWKSIGLDDEESRKLDNSISWLNLARLNLTIGEVQEAFLIDQIGQEKPSTKPPSFTIRHANDRDFEKVDDLTTKTWIDRTRSWESWLKTKHSQTTNPIELLINAASIKLKVLKRQVESSSKLVEALKPLL